MIHRVTVHKERRIARPRRGDLLVIRDTDQHVTRTFRLIPTKHYSCNTCPMMKLTVRLGTKDVPYCAALPISCSGAPNKCIFEIIKEERLLEDLL